MNSNDELITVIKNKLSSHSSLYDEGSWEVFNSSRKSKRKSFFFYRIAGIAAMILVAAYFGFESLPIPEQPKEAKRVSKSIKFTPKIKTEKPEPGNQYLKRDNQYENPHKDINGYTQIIDTRNSLPQSNDIKFQQLTILANTNSTNSVITNNVIANQTIADTLTGERIVVLKDESKPASEAASTYESAPSAKPALLESKEGEARPEKIAGARQIKYTFSFSPAVGSGNQGLNFSSGFGIKYPIAPLMNINTGINLTAMNVGKNTGNTSGGAGKVLQDIQAQVTGIEIPLSLEYKAGKTLIAAVSISGMRVFKDQMKYNYTEEKTKIVTVLSFGGQPRQEAMKYTEKTAVKSPEKTSDYLGFFTISAGTQQPFGNKNLSIEPFVKLPLKGYSTENMKLSQGGVRISVSF